MKTLIQNATIIYPGVTKKEDILIDQGIIKEIRPSIRMKGDAFFIDGSSLYVLPGFISGDERGTTQGITTRVKSIRIREEQMSDKNVDPLNDEEELFDYVYHVSLPRLTKQAIEFLDKKRVKVIRVEDEDRNSGWQKIEWQDFEQRILRSGLVADVDEKDYNSMSKLSIPIMLPYSRWSYPTRSRTIIRVTDLEKEGGWQRKWNRMDPVVMRSYWLDQSDMILPKLEKDQEVERYLIRLSYVRSRLPAKLFGIFPMKGSIRVGADADLLLVGKESLRSNAGASFQCKTMLKGRFVDTVNNDGKFLYAHQTYAFAY
ncbi:hypothetical protein [Ammoniphilus sp. CFH 90114]|uniref:hypothetical protein n=1 Tax=Ammoniphilus sp. CFH 90114 TaxID=2493665 RepID=UPI00100F299B|nr:hypothetical protein [Ammoniphilus sp. CFH 90114]RXT13924.1 hypothetical protein EIZ39_07255 [Ammoniphilus sp. CFH 90114]